MDKIINIAGLVSITFVSCSLIGMTMKWWGQMNIVYGIAFVILSGLAISVVCSELRKALGGKKHK